MTIESFNIEINIRKKKWLLVCTHNPNKNLISNHLKEINKNLDNYSSKCDNGKNFIQFSTKNGWLAASDLFHVFTQSIKLHCTFHYRVLTVQMFEKSDSSNRQ